MPVSSSFSRWYFPFAAAVGAAALIGTIYALHQAFLVLGPHMPKAAFFIFAPPETPGGNPGKLYDSYRIFFLHLPSALAAATVSGLMAMGAILSFISRHRRWEALIVASAEIGVIACFLTMATGYFWGAFAWGTGWTWEPRLTATLVLWLSYLALLLLRAAIAEPEQRRLVTAGYALLTIPLYPLVSKAIEWFGRESHPMNVSNLLGDSPIAATLNVAKPSIIGLFLFFIMVRYWQVRLRQDVALLRAEFLGRISFKPKDHA